MSTKGTTEAAAGGDDRRGALEAHFDGEFETDSDDGPSRVAQCSSFGPGCVRS